MTLTEVRNLLTELGVRPSKALGQNFLIDGNILPIILREADIRPDETVIEIGPGLGMLTQELVDRAERVIAIEKDSRLAGYLRRKLPEVELIEGDAVEVLGRAEARSSDEKRCPSEGHASAWPLPPFDKVVANLPYSISTPILERLVEGESKPLTMVVTLQREVGRRLAARPRTKDYGALTLFTHLYYHVTVAHIVSPRCFFPSPRVQSAIVVLNRRDPQVQLRASAPFHEIVRLGFSQRRKMLHKLLAGFANVDAAFAAAGVPLTVRAEELTLVQWIKLANALS